MVFEATFEILLGLLVANISLLIALFAYISPKNDDQRVKRKKMLDEKVNSEIKSFSNNNASIKDLLPLFEEYKKIDQWDGALKSISIYFLFSIALTFSGIVFCIFDSEIIIADVVSVESLFAIGGGLFLFSGIMQMIFHQVDVHEWKVKNETIEVVKES